MNYKLLLRTVSHLKPTQLAFQVRYRLHKAHYVQMPAPTRSKVKGQRLVLATEPIPRYKGVEGDEFTFLNLTHKFTDWNFVGNGTLWTYNLNYFDFLNQGRKSKVEGQRDALYPKEACKWIDRWIEDVPSITWGLDPYPIALRGINWIKFFCRHPECATQEREDSLWSQYKLLEKKLEYHLLGNHLLEDAYSIYVGGCYFDDDKLRSKGYKLLISQLTEQTLSDGAHYEQSPMYHCILLDRLLDCINAGLGSKVEGLRSEVEELKAIAERQLGWLKSICYKDGTWPMFNDAALGIAPIAADIIDYAHRLGIESEATPLGESGYRKLCSESIEAMIDCGCITATYQPGHTHADSLNYELRIDDKPVVVDTGISTYDKTPRRQYERSTIAHNCVVVEGKNSDEVWGGFRVGRHCSAEIIKEGLNHIEAWHDGFGKKCYRTFELRDGVFSVEDRYDGEAVSYIHLADGVDPERVKIDGAKSVEILDTRYSVEYNRFIDNKTIAIHFNGVCRYSIK